MAWAERTLGDVCDEVNGIIQTGPFGSQLHESDYVSAGVPVVMPKNIVDGRVSTDDIAYISEDDARRLERHVLLVGDIVYGRRGDIGRRALITERERGWLCGTGCLRLSLGDKVVDPRYLYYFLGQTSVIAWIANQAVGATLPNLNTGILRSVNVRYPSLLTQQRIASILSAYDDLIENNTRRIKILEQMAQMIYREWFENFRFPGHGKVKLVESEVGLIPESFQVHDMGQVIEFENGKACVNEKEGAFPLYGSNGVIGRCAVAKYRDAVIVGRVGAYCGSTMYCRDGFWASDNTIVAKPAPGSNLCVEFVYFLLQNMNLRRYAGGAAQPLLTQNVLRQLPCVVPDERINTRFYEISSPLLTLILNLHRQVEKLRQMRELLLPKLVSGEISAEHLETQTAFVLS